ncbi:MAG TPA: glycosyltransferase family 4 protein, partial [Gemmatimonadaceae bacterium]
MRILLVNDYATATAGAERITRDLRDGFRARGHEVRVFASRAQLIPGESFADAECYGTTSRLRTFSSAVNLSAARALALELRDFQPDVVQVQMFLWQLSPAILPVLRSVPAVYWAMTFK